MAPNKTIFWLLYEQRDARAEKLRLITPDEEDAQWNLKIRNQWREDDRSKFRLELSDRPLEELVRLFPKD
jgi:hypothetical protein